MTVNMYIYILIYHIQNVHLILLYMLLWINIRYIYIYTWIWIYSYTESYFIILYYIAHMGITRRQKTCITLFASRGCQEFHVLLKRLAFRVAWIHSGSIYILSYTDLSLWFWDLSHSCLWLKPLFCHGGPSRTGEMCVSFRSCVGPCSRNKSNTWNDGFWRTGHATLCHTVSCATPVSRVSRMSPGVRSLSAWRWRWIRRRNRASKSGDAKKLQPLGSRRLKILRILFKIFSLAQRWYVYSKCESKDLSSNHPQSRQPSKKKNNSLQISEVSCLSEVMDSKAMLPGQLPRCKAGVSPWKTPMWRSHRYEMQSQCHTCHTLRLNMIESFFKETHETS